MGSRAKHFALLTLLAGAPVVLPGQPPPRPAPATASQQKQGPPPVVAEPEEEDESSKPKEYTLNPLQAEQEIRIGNFYAKKGSNKAAARRYEEATRWNPASGEAFLKLAEMREKLSDWKAAKAAYEKYLQLEPAGGRADSIRKKLAQHTAKK